jgi:hypothetical protein
MQNHWISRNVSIVQNYKQLENTKFRKIYLFHSSNIERDIIIVFVPEIEIKPS